VYAIPDAYLHPPRLNPRGKGWFRITMGTVASLLAQGSRECEGSLLSRHGAKEGFATIRPEA
jgi:hypothetical protein